MADGDLRPSWRLGHRLPRPPAGVAQWFELHPVPVDRPVAGEVVAVVACGTCDEPVACVVSSIAVRDRRRARAHRRRLLLRALRAGAVLCGLVGFGWAARSATTSGLGLVLTVVVLAGGLIFAMAVHDAVERMRMPVADDGLRLARPSPGHEIRLPGGDREYCYDGDNG
ncbi:hypothetical protein BJY16_004584 [Actinoplanes octamycinicus]|uniref:Uncharacterized protein n=1 Tax=Actinoplanes octamycinicus TaxID=135948 RepID=A0A7W7GZD0_9ACTN|nr:hypothetical protein [Actinoplanes octamycinicus]MBB4741125.1 hypothetical protein [Actinoplanes octamycinicus]GIE56032.1 hypothetical protein Aoc01nite_14340 [Actinoplanes octamycinicus]